MSLLVRVVDVMVLLWLLVLSRVVVDDAPCDVGGAGGDANGEGVVVTRSRGGPATGRCGTRASEQAGKALSSQGHQCAHVM